MTKSKKDLKKSVPDGVDPKSAQAEEAPANVAAVAKPKVKVKAKSKSAKAPADQNNAAESAQSAQTEPQKDISNKEYEKALAGLQIELVKLQEWIKFKKLKVVVIFEGRDAAGKGGCIKRITESLSPRITRVVALPAPTEREKSQWYFQRYVQHLPAAGEMVLFDRSWYNRAGVEHVMGFCQEDEPRFSISFAF